MYLVVVHASNSSCSCPQNIRLAVPPDLPDDSLPLLQSLGSLQLLGRRENIRCAVQLAVVVVADGNLSAGGGGGGSHGGRGHRHDDLVFVVVVVVVVVVAVVLVFAAGVLQPFALEGCGRDGDPRLAGDPDHQETERQHQPKAHPDHKVKTEALWVCCEGETHQMSSGVTQLGGRTLHTERQGCGLAKGSWPTGGVSLGIEPSIF